MRKGLLNKLRAQLSNTNGETLVETLVATLIMALVMLMLCTAIVSAAKINASAKDTATSFNQGAAASTQEVEVHVTIVHEDEPPSPVQVTGETQNGYVYYYAEQSN